MLSLAQERKPMERDMKLLSTFYCNDGSLAAGWWATLEYPDGRRVVRHLWDDEAGPDFDDLAG